VTIQPRFLASFAIALSLSMPGVAAQQSPGTLAGKATDDARRPYLDYAVQIRDVATGRVVQTEALNSQGVFIVSDLALTKTYLIELLHQREHRVVCTEGPFTLTSTTPSKSDVNISCGRMPSSVWLLLAGAGAAAAVTVATRSVSR
jgi:hypothetical protein